jgi:ribose/xylose/arabinose/galactoside ABC-type transport system permease subunit
VERQHVPVIIVIPIALDVGALGGFLTGHAIHDFEIQPFTVTRAGLFLLRGLCLGRGPGRPAGSSAGLRGTRGAVCHPVTRSPARI